MLSVKLYLAGGMVMVMSWQVNLLVLLLTVVMCLASALFSIRKIKTIDPAMLFRG
jgi:putative ABC transport system permease protein